MPPLPLNTSPLRSAAKNGGTCLAFLGLSSRKIRPAQPPDISPILHAQHLLADEQTLIARGLYAEGLTLVEIAGEFGVANRPHKHPPAACGTE